MAAQRKAEHRVTSPTSKRQSDLRDIRCQAPPALSLSPESPEVTWGIKFASAHPITTPHSPHVTSHTTHPSGLSLSVTIFPGLNLPRRTLLTTPDTA